MKKLGCKTPRKYKVPDNFKSDFADEICFRVWEDVCRGYTKITSEEIVDIIIKFKNKQNEKQNFKHHLGIFFNNFLFKDK
jgi:hypothetical protein